MEQHDIAVAVLITVGLDRVGIIPFLYGRSEVQTFVNGGLILGGANGLLQHRAIGVERPARHLVGHLISLGGKHLGVHAEALLVRSQISGHLSIGSIPGEVFAPDGEGSLRSSILLIISEVAFVVIRTVIAIEGSHEGSLKALVAFLPHIYRLASRCIFRVRILSAGLGWVVKIRTIVVLQSVTSFSNCAGIAGKIVLHRENLLAIAFVCRKPFLFKRHGREVVYSAHLNSLFCPFSRFGEIAISIINGVRTIYGICNSGAEVPCGSEVHLSEEGSTSALGSVTNVVFFVERSRICHFGEVLDETGIDLIQFRTRIVAVGIVDILGNVRYCTKLLGEYIIHIRADEECFVRILAFFVVIDECVGSVDASVALRIQALDICILRSVDIVLELRCSLKVRHHIEVGTFYKHVRARHYRLHERVGVGEELIGVLIKVISSGLTAGFLVLGLEEVAGGHSTHANQRESQNIEFRFHNFFSLIYLYCGLDIH